MIKQDAHYTMAMALVSDHADDLEWSGAPAVHDRLRDCKMHLTSIAAACGLCGWYDPASVAAEVIILYLVESLDKAFGDFLDLDIDVVCSTTFTREFLPLPAGVV